jgi:hypothetical protein
MTPGLPDGTEFDMEYDEATKTYRMVISYLNFQSHRAITKDEIMTHGSSVNTLTETIRGNIRDMAQEIIELVQSHPLVESQ